MTYYEPIYYTVSPEDEGMLLRTVLHNRMGISRKLVSRLKLTEQGISVNGERRYTDTKVQSGDRIAIRMERETSDDILPQELPIDILYEDDDVLVLNKEAGRIVHPTHGHYTDTIANGVVHYWNKQGQSFRFRPVHRLDQETSGALAIAKNPYVHQQISEQMQAHTVKKEYIAFVHGTVETDGGTIDAPIDRDPESPHVRIVTPSGYPAVTHYQVERRFPQATMVRLRLETGRTHQIRVHMKHLGHPLLGDKMYGPDPGCPDSERFGGFDAGLAADSRIGEGRALGVLRSAGGPTLARQALHAAVLGFTHPGSRRWMEFEAPLPADLQACLAWLERTAD